MSLADFPLAGLAFLGHFAFCVATFNRLHAYGIPRKLRRRLELLLLAWFVVLCGMYGWLMLGQGRSLVIAGAPGWWDAAFLAYPLVCWMLVVLALPCWLWPRLTRHSPRCLISNHSTRVDVQNTTGPLDVHGRKARFLARFPGNEIYHLQTQVKRLRVPRLPAKLQGLTLTHLSDLHFTGELDQRFYDFAVDAANDLHSDIVILTGDIIEAVECEPWILSTLGRLTAPLGKYFVLGNHDRRMPSISRVRELMLAAGFVDVGGRVLDVIWREESVLLVGDERPWFPGPDENAIRSRLGNSFPLLLTHTPDRFPWAKTMGFPLTLAGHNHGGQIRFPLIGPLISPSKWGTRYASGIFEEQSCLLHVSRGLGGEHALRWNCPPELAQLVLEPE